MTAKKKASSTKTTKAPTPKSKVVSSSTKGSSTKPSAKKATSSNTIAKKKAVSTKAAKPPAKKAEVKSTKKPAAKSAAKKATSTKTVAKKKATSVKAVKSNPAAKKTPSKKPTSKPTQRKTAKPSAKLSSKSSDSISATKKVASAVLSKGKETAEEKVSEGLGFSIDDVRKILQNKKKSKKKPKPVAQSEPKSSKTVRKAVEKKIPKVKKVQTASINDILGFGTVTVAKKPVRDENKVPKEWANYYKILKSMRDSLKGSLGERSSETIGASARESGELSLNSSDSGTETFDRDLALSMVANDQEALEEIEDAIDRIFDGSYGICQETKKPIKKNRLQAVPFTRFSLEGQMQYEKNSRRERDSGAGAFATISDSTMGQDD